ncbi:hypothetical protein E2553_07760 [Paraburkholderia dipogonis]|uniref:Uncharacterized protein n=1 Tax=Paraburkholderia dipogonis TaxID=1211383 RepID=A0A4Y8N554_9BURK|nr:hypothetical protein [Paraburkholderia dipogonis]TFE44920.1 hypothetical protein E2553_07760 [Paraburkholderia dipogonis]
MLHDEPGHHQAVARVDRGGDSALRNTSWLQTGRAALPPGMTELVFNGWEAAGGVAQFDDLLAVMTPSVIVPALTTVEGLD